MVYFPVLRGTTVWIIKVVNNGRAYERVNLSLEIWSLMANGVASSVMAKGLLLSLLPVFINLNSQLNATILC